MWERAERGIFTWHKAGEFYADERVRTITLGTVKNDYSDEGDSERPERADRAVRAKLDVRGRLGDAEVLALMNQRLHSNGLAYRPVYCVYCGRFQFKEAVLMGGFLLRCPNCKMPNVPDMNRVGEQELMDYLARKHEMTG